MTDDHRTEYLEIGEWCRHDDAMIYQAGSILLPLSFGAIVAAAQFPTAKGALAFFSISIYLYWLLISIRLSWFASVRLQRARELEHAAGFQHQLAVETPPPQLAAKLGRRLSIRITRWFFLVVLVVGWFALL